MIWETNVTWLTTTCKTVPLEVMKNERLVQQKMSADELLPIETIAIISRSSLTHQIHVILNHCSTSQISPAHKFCFYQNNWLPTFCWGTTFHWARSMPSQICDINFNHLSLVQKLGRSIKTSLWGRSQLASSMVNGHAIQVSLIWMYL